MSITWHWYAYSIPSALVDFTAEADIYESASGPIVMGAPYREVNSKVATAPKLKVEDKDKVNNSRRIKAVKLNIVKLKASLNKFS